jgi:glycosyltransferase involved in cell wall biosynthesis
MLVLHRSEPDCFVHAALPTGGKVFQRLRHIVSTKVMARQVSPTNTGHHSINLFSSGLANYINRSDFDIVNLHWIGDELMSIEEIGHIRKPICWTMHDMWPFCGAEHLDDLNHPERYISGYVAKTRPPLYSGPDLDAWTWRRKRRAWAAKTFHLISPSQWLARCASQSELMRTQNCTVIPNCVDTDIFKPIDRILARRILNLDPNKQYILFGAVSSTTNRLKGFHLLQVALQHLSARDDIRSTTELLIFGAHSPLRPPDLGLRAHYLGNFYDETSLALLYSAANVFVLPSMQENLPNTIVESICCGTPCVAFDIGGVSDIISQGFSGQLVTAFDTYALSVAVSTQLEVKEPINHDHLRIQRQRYSTTSCHKKYIPLYEGILKNQ